MLQRWGAPLDAFWYTPETSLLETAPAMVATRDPHAAGWSLYGWLASPVNRLMHA